MLNYALDCFLICPAIKPWSILPRYPCILPGSLGGKPHRAITSWRRTVLRWSLICLHFSAQENLDKSIPLESGFRTCHGRAHFQPASVSLGPYPRP